mgnify:CR=1 FL=1
MNVELKAPFPYFGVDGSRYHVDSNTSGDLAVMDLLKGEFATDLAICVEDTRIHLCHAIGHTTSPASKATAPAKEAAHAEISRPAFGKFDLLLRGHRHDYYQWDNGETHIVGCPSWKSRDHFAATREWEWRQWLDAVTDWELKRYFEII